MTHEPDALARALYHAQIYLAQLKEAPVGAPASLAALRGRLDKPLSDEGLDASAVIDQLVADAGPGLMGSAGGRFFGWVIGGATPTAIAADWLTAIWDQNAALYACSPASAVAEEIAGAWLKEILGIPAQSSFAFVTGCQMAHVTCLAAARHDLLQREGWSVEEQGLTSAPAIRVLASESGHGSIARAATLLGLGRKNIVRLTTDGVGRIIPEAVTPALEDGRPSILVLQAGDIATGAFDAFETLIPLAKAKDAWVHIDGAFGLWVSASPGKRHLVRGAAGADSWATDGHKWLNVPFDSGYAFVSDARAHSAALSYRADYLTHAADARDQIDWNPDWSRRARGFATYAALRALGRKGVADIVDRSCAHTAALVDGLRNLQGVEIVSEPIVNQALVRFLEPGGAETNHDYRTDKVIDAINAGGQAFFSGSTWRGRRVMRISVCNWRTDVGDVERVISAIREAHAAV